MSLIIRCASAALVMATAAVPVHASEPTWRFNGRLDIPSLCASIESQTMEPEPRHDSVLYMYESELYDAAGVRPDDAEDKVNEKVRTLLDRNMSSLTCNQLGFMPPNGSVLKLAVARQNREFIDHVLRDWKPDLNRIDAADGRTVLDYIAWQRDRYGPNQTAYRSFQRMYEAFRKAGAKTRTELETLGSTGSIADEQGRLLAAMAAKADAGDFQAAMSLWGSYRGVYEVYGRKITPDAGNAAKWRRRAESIANSKTDAKKFVLLGEALRGQDQAAAAAWFAKAAALDDPDGQFMLGRAYAEGAGVSKNLHRALELMTKANGRDFGAFSLLWGGSVEGWLGHRDRQVAWYRTAWQQGLRSSEIPGYPTPRTTLSDPRGPLALWFDEHRLDVCGTTIWNNTSCP